jgi:hypothetical protein
MYGKIPTFQMNLRPSSSGYSNDTAGTLVLVCQTPQRYIPKTTILKHSTLRQTRIGAKCLQDRLFEVELLRLRKGHFFPLTNRFKNSLKRCEMQ